MTMHIPIHILEMMLAHPDCDLNDIESMSGIMGRRGLTLQMCPQIPHFRTPEQIEYEQYLRLKAKYEKRVSSGLNDD